jgi:hypothetical protein
VDKIKMTVDEWYNTYAVEVTLPTSDDFLKIKETLTRIGIGTHKEGQNCLYQTCHILQKRGKYYIVHFKELLLLDGKEVDITDFDLKRRNTITGFLAEWKLLNVVSPDDIEDKASTSSIKIIPFAEKRNWELVPKYTIGAK